MNIPDHVRNEVWNEVGIKNYYLVRDNVSIRIRKRVLALVGEQIWNQAWDRFSSTLGLDELTWEVESDSF